MKRTELKKFPLEAERTWEMEGVPVLQLKLCLPQPQENAGTAARRIRRYYQRLSRACQLRCERVLLPQAQAACRAALASSAPLPCFSVEVGHQVMLEENGIQSLSVGSRTLAGPGPAQLIRWGDTWDLSNGCPLPLSAFFPQGTPWKRVLLDAAARSMASREAAGVSRYWDSWQRDLPRRFDPRRFYLTGEGLCFFYGMDELGPAGEGLPVFSLPYGPDGPFPVPR